MSAHDPPSGHFRKRPVVVFAVRLTPETEDDIVQWLGDSFSRYGSHAAEIRIATLEGVMTASSGDWIVKGVKGEFYPVKPDIFDLTYEPVDVEDA